MRKTMQILMIAALLLAGLLVQPVRAQVSVRGPYDLWVDMCFIGSDRYPGGTVVFVATFTNAGRNTSSVVESVDAFTLTLPWQAYVATGLPVTIYPGQQLGIIFNVTIPEDQAPSEVVYMVYANWSYLSGATWVTADPLIFVRTETILPNPYALQDEVASLQANISSLTETISSQNATIASQKATITSLRSDITSLRSDVSSLTQTITSQNETIASLNANLAASEQTVDSLRVQVSNLTATVATQNETINSQNTQISQLQTTVTSQTDSIMSLQGQVSSLQADLNTTRTEMYLLIATTVIFLATTAYFAMRKPRPA